MRILVHKHSRYPGDKRFGICPSIEWFPWTTVDGHLVEYSQLQLQCFMAEMKLCSSNTDNHNDHIVTVWYFWLVVWYNEILEVVL
uniref:Uncharacterized protein n=1 Tax=Cannabis sativa TaxID=3483 RepID=A0A803PTZ8_CANSA